MVFKSLVKLFVAQIELSILNGSHRLFEALEYLFEVNFVSHVEFYCSHELSVHPDESDGNEGE